LQVARFKEARAAHRGARAPANWRPPVDSELTNARRNCSSWVAPSPRCGRQRAPRPPGSIDLLQPFRTTRFLKLLGATAGRDARSARARIAG